MGKIWLTLFSFLVCAPVLGEERKVYVFGWANYVPASVIRDFEEETGITVIYDSCESSEELEAKLVSDSGYDIVIPSAWPVFARGIKYGAFRPLDLKKLPHARGLDPEIMARLRSADPELRYGVPYVWATTGIGYREDLLPKGASRDSWALLFSKDVVKKLSGSIGLLDSPFEVFQTAMIYLGHNPLDETRAHWDQAIALVASIRPYVSHMDNLQQSRFLLDGDVCAFQGWSTYINMAKAEGKRLGKDIRYVIPKEGAIMWIDMLAIPKRAPNPNNAHKFIDFILRPRIMARVSNAVYSANAVPASRKWIDRALLSDPSVFPSKEMFARLYPDIIPSLALRRYLGRAWLRIKTGYAGK